MKSNPLPQDVGAFQQAEIGDVELVGFGVFQPGQQRLNTRRLTISNIGLYQVLGSSTYVCFIDLGLRAAIVDWKAHQAEVSTGCAASTPAPLALDGEMVAQTEKSRQLAGQVVRLGVSGHRLSSQFQPTVASH
jgi:hypothetical protein